MVGVVPVLALIVLQIAAAKNAELTEATGSDIATSYQWNTKERDLPLLGLNAPRLSVGFDQALAFSGNQFDLAISHNLTFDDESGKYLLPTLTKDKHVAFIELTATGTPNTFMSIAGIQLLEKKGLKVVKTSDGTSYLFTEYPDGEFRCSTIKQPNGPQGSGRCWRLTLHGVSDSNGRSVTFNYGQHGIQSVTQTWMANLEGITRTWVVGEEASEDDSVRYAHAVGVKSGKFLPANALVREYTSEMADCDRLLARIFGGPNAVVGANGFEPAGLGASYPLYRGDTLGDDGKVRRGHLSYALHMYGSPDGRGDSPVYVPAGFTSHSSEPTPTDAAVTFYYPKIGNLTDVTLAVFHVSDFQITSEGDRVRVGNIGGPGGSSPLYRHSHIEFYKGNVGLPAAAARAALRINPATVFGK